MEGKERKTTQRRMRRRLVPVLAVLALLFVLGGAVYSADRGGIVSRIQIWLQGDWTIPFWKLYPDL